MRTEWKYAPGDRVRLADGEVCKISAREHVREGGRAVPAYEAMRVRDGRVGGPVRLVREAGIAGRFVAPGDPA